jgi:hypothetical protein
MNINALTAGRLLKSAVVFLTQICLLSAQHARVRIHVNYYQSFFPNLQEQLQLFQPGMAAVVDAAVVPAVPVTIKT